MSIEGEELEQLPPQGHVKVVYLGAVAPHWEVHGVFGDGRLIDEFRQRANPKKPFNRLVNVFILRGNDLSPFKIYQPQLIALIHLAQTVCKPHAQAVVDYGYHNFPFAVN